MVNRRQVSGTFRLTGIRFQEIGGRGAILVGDRLDDDGRPIGRTVLQMPGRLARRGRPFHVAQTMMVRGAERLWMDPRTSLEERQILVGEWFEVQPRGDNWVDYVSRSPAFSGIGRATARSIWDKVGSNIFDLLAGGTASKLADAVPSLGDAKARILVQAWAECGQERLVQWLDDYRLPRKLSDALLRAYADQDDAVSRLTADPYRLLSFGIGWAKVDEIAQTLFAIQERDPRRLHAAVVTALMDDYSSGHTASDTASLAANVGILLHATPATVAAALRLVFNDGGFVRADKDLFQLRGVHIMERSIAADLAGRIGLAAQFGPDARIDDAIDEFQRGSATDFRLTLKQRLGVSRGYALPLSILVGGAGTGKTACLAALHHVIERIEGRKDAVLQMALAGRAAKRMRDATGRDAVTIAGFLHTVDDNRIADITHVVIDEASMLDVPGFFAVLRRLNGRAKIVLVGDDFQLPPIGGGKILHLLTQRDDVTVTVLDRVWRQEDGNSIRMVATAVREGEVPNPPKFVGPLDGVSIIDPGSDVSETARHVFEMLGGVETESDICVLAPSRHAGYGNAQAINTAIHKGHFSEGKPVIGRIGDTGFCVGDRFVCDVNHWDLDLMNGSLGRIVRMATMGESEAVRQDRRERGLSDIGTPVAYAEVDGEIRLLDDLHLRDCSWGYALTCHRAQGSDFGRVIVVLDDRIDRSWLYTAITRGRRQVVLIGTLPQFCRAIATMPKVSARRVALDTLLNRAMPAHG